MDEFKKKKNSKFTLILVATALFVSGSIVVGIFQGKSSQKLSAAEVEGSTANKPSPLPEDLKLAVDKTFKSTSEWPLTLDVNNKKVKVEYPFIPELVTHIKKTLQAYRSDYTTVTVMDNETGQVLAAVGYEGKKNAFDSSLVLSSTHPSASLIKIVTAAELIRSEKVTKDTSFVFRGKSTTLFRYQLNDSKNARWDKSQTFEEAFAKSNNVIFGKAAIKNIASDKLIFMAENFGFNHPIVPELDFLQSHITTTIEDDFKLAETASGFNNDTEISPIHAALMASIIANNGVMKNPQVISKIVDATTGESLWQNTSLERRVLSPQASKEMQELMRLTIDNGTAKKSFRRMNHGYKNAIDMGGKTGSITGGKPFGKRDWFAAYAIPRDIQRGSGISISVMNVNVKKWHVRSTMLAKDIIEYYYNNIKPVPITMVKMPKFLAEKRRRKRNYIRNIASKQTVKKNLKVVAR